MSLKVTPKDTLRVYWHSARRYKLLLVVILFGIGGGTVIQVVIPIYYKEFFDLVTAYLAGGTPLRNPIEILFIILGFNIIAWTIWRASAVANNYFQPHVMDDLTQSAYEYLQRHAYGFFTSRFVGALVRKITRLARAFERFADQLYWHFFPLAIRIVGAVLVLFIFSRTIAAILFAWIVIFIVLNYFFSKWKLKYDEARAEKDTETVAVIADAVTNHNNIQLFNGFAFEARRLKNVLKEWRRLMTLTWNMGTVIEGVQAALFIIAEFFFMYLALGLVRQGRMTVGDIVLVQSYLIILINHLWDVGRHIRDTYESFADAEEAVEILNMPHEINDAPGAARLRVPRGAIAFKNMSFSFRETRTVLRDINLTISAGEKVALIGPSGAGKSTLVKLLFRLYDTTGGAISIDGQPIHRATQESLRRALSLVPQDPILFHRSLMENIRYGRREATDKEVIRVAKLAHCEEFINDLPQKYDTFVGERGIKLSGGERQRVAIARAILKDAPILVLDEATSSLDSHSEALIQDALKKLMKGKTVIVIAHRLSTIRQMDRIVVLEGGKIIDEGSHEELLARRSLYRKLWELQAGGFLTTISA